MGEPAPVSCHTFLYSLVAQETAATPMGDNQAGLYNVPRSQDKKPYKCPVLAEQTRHKAELPAARFCIKTTLHDKTLTHFLLQNLA